MIALLLGILIASSGVVESAQIEFKDISGHWAKDIIIETASKGFINGYEDLKASRCHKKAIRVLLFPDRG